MPLFLDENVRFEVLLGRLALYARGSGVLLVVSLFSKVSIYSCLQRIAGADRAIPDNIVGLVFVERWLETER